LSPQGVCIITGFSTMPHFIASIVIGPVVSMFGTRKVVLQGMATTPTEDLLVLRELLASGKIVPVIDRCYPLYDTAEALRYLEQGHARGKVIVMVGA
jgi:NADPH:quinone reductase-like Zn-dependent oxidoreductase